MNFKRYLFIAIIGFFLGTGGTLAQSLTPEKPSKDFTFSVITADFKRMQWGLTGPKGANAVPFANLQRIVLSPSGKELYQHDDHNFKITNLATGASISAPLPSNFPPFAWLSSVAYDTKRNIVALATFGQEEGLYRLDAINKKWLDTKPLKFEILYSLTYDATVDRYVGWNADGTLIFISGEGVLHSKKAVAKKLPGFNQFYNSKSGENPPVVLAAEGDNIAILYVVEGDIKAIWNYRADTDEAKLTYKKTSSEISRASPNKTASNDKKPFSFNLLGSDYKWVSWTTSGPKGSNLGLIANPWRNAISPNGQQLYQHDQHSFKITDLVTGSPISAPLPANFPRFSWISGIAYDTKRNIVSVVSHGGEGFLYRFDAIKKKWLDMRSLNDLDLYALTYDPRTDRYAAIDREGELVFISGEGNFLFKKRVIDKLPDFKGRHGIGVFHRPDPPILLAAQENNIAIIIYDKGNIKSIWHYDLNEETATLNYAK